MTTLAINEITNQGNIILICFHSNNELDNFYQRLDHIPHDFNFYTDLQSCITFIQTIRKQKIFLIIPSTQCPSSFCNFDQIETIFLYSSDDDQDGYTSLENPKIIGIYNNIDLLCSSIQQQIDYIEKQKCTWCFFDQHEYATRDLSKQANDFIWIQLLHEVLSDLPYNMQRQGQKIDSKHYHDRHNLKELKLLNEFEKTKYESKQTLACFMKNLSIQNIINESLLTENTNLLYTLRYFMLDLLENLSQQHQQIFSSNRKKLIVYQQMKLSNYEFKQILKNKGKLMAMKGFLIAHTHQPVSTKQTDLISVLLEIECDIEKLDNDAIFADVTQFTESPPGQETFLFNFNTSFLLENIEQKDGIWAIKLNVVSDGRSILRRYIDDTRRQIENLSIPIMFGKLLSDMSQWNQSQEYFQRLMTDSSNEDLAWIDQSLGQAHQWKGEWDKAREYYDRAYERMMQCQPARIKDSGIVLCNIGEILYAQGKYEESLDVHQRALSIRKEYFPSNHAHIATCLISIGLIKYHRLKDDEALTLFREALTIQEEYYNHFHVSIATTRSHIGTVITMQENYDSALDYHQQAMTIYEKYYPLGHVYMASNLNRICFCLRQQDKYEESLNAIQQALAIQKKFYPFGHIEITNSLYNLASLKFNQNKYDDALKLCEQTLMLERKYYSSNHLNIVSTLNIIGYIQVYGKYNYEQARHYHQQALDILEESYPSYYGHIAMTFNYMGDLSKRQSKYDEALIYFQQALKMQDDYYLSDSIDMCIVLNNIAETLTNQEKYAEALNYYQRILTIRKKYHPINHINVAIAFRAVGYVRRKDNKLDEALDDFQQALSILEEYHPTKYSEIIYCLESSACIYFGKSHYTVCAEYYQRCLRISEASLSSTNAIRLRILSSLALVQRHRQKHQSSLSYELKCLTIRELIFPPNHQDIGKSLFNIGRCYQHLNQLAIALEYYKRTLVIYEQCLPVNNADRKSVVVKIQQLSETLEPTNI